MTVPDTVVNSADLVRAAEAFVKKSDGQEVARLTAILERGFYQEDPVRLRHLEGATRSFLRGRKVRALIPMLERVEGSGDRIGGTLEHLTGMLPRGSITVVDAGSSSAPASCEEAIRAVRDFADARVNLLFEKDILGHLDWGRLLPLMGLTERPHGKGMTVLAGNLSLYIAGIEEKGHWIFQSDADITEYARYNPLAHLVRPIVGAERGQTHNHVKMAKPDRNNETTMAFRDALRLFQLPYFGFIPEPVRRRCEQLRERLLPHLWMLTGEFMMKAWLAFTRPYAVGYCEETAISIAIEDLNAGRGRGRITANVENANPRLDRVNSARKEAIMMDRIGAFILGMGLYGVPVDHWTLKDFETFNTGVLAPLDQVVYIPEQGPVRCEAVEFDRLVPGIHMLEENELIDLDGIRKHLRVRLVRG